MIKITDKSQCSGCGACADVCPKSCIEFKEDRKGFIYPKVDIQRCIECGACKRVCPLIPDNVKTQEPVECRAAWAKNQEIHTSSSSGGLGQILAIHFIENNGVAYGCSGVEPWHVRHIRIDKLEDIRKIRGSKYVQSDTRGIYKLIKKDIRDGRKVLFVGTPCQASAVKNLFAKEPDNLYCVDLICHGVPSQKMLNDQIESIVGRKKLHDVVSLSFRKNTEYTFDLKYKNSDNESVTSVKEPFWKVPYFREFYNCRSLRPSCYKCPYAAPQRKGDMTIGDFWGIKNAGMLPKSASYGVSAVLINTEKGKSLFEAVKDRLNEEQRTVEEALQGNDKLRGSSVRSLRGEFFQMLYQIFPIVISSFISNSDLKFRTLLRIMAKKARLVK